MTNVIPCRDPLNPPQPGTVAYGLMVSCLKCNERLLWREAYADLDGPAFRAYYHAECRPVCNDGCSMCDPCPARTPKAPIIERVLGDSNNG